MGHNRRTAREGEEDNISSVRSFVIIILMITIITTNFVFTEWVLCNGNQIKEDNVGRAYSRYEEMEKSIQCLRQEAREMKGRR
jgi:hypothetical protein